MFYSKGAKVTKITEANGAKCVSVKSRAESVGSICLQTCRGSKYGLIVIERMKRVASEFERDSHVEDID
jgi:hypothetical protein